MRTVRHSLDILYLPFHFNVCATLPLYVRPFCFSSNCYITLMPGTPPSFFFLLLQGINFLLDCSSFSSGVAVWILVLCFCGTRITEVYNRFRGENKKVGGSSREVGEVGEICITNSCVQIDEERDEVQANIHDMFESDNPLWHLQFLNILIGQAAYQLPDTQGYLHSRFFSLLPSVSSSGTSRQLCFDLYLHDEVLNDTTDGG